jgi:hypothetical protein
MVYTLVSKMNLVALASYVAEAIERTGVAIVDVDPDHPDDFRVSMAEPARTDDRVTQPS